MRVLIASRAARSGVLAVSVSLWPILGLSQSTPANPALDHADKLYELGDYEQALSVLGDLDPSALDDAEQTRLQATLRIVEGAAAGAAQARTDYNSAVVAMVNRDHKGAKTLFQAALDNARCPVELRISARARLARIRLIERRAARALQMPSRSRPASQTPGHPTPPAARPTSKPADALQMARELVRQGMAAVDRAEYDLAQHYFNKAIMQVPDAPWEQIRVDPGGVDVSRYPLTSITHEHVVHRPPRVTMNLNLGVGRLVAVNSFPFAGGPTSGVGAPGFVQLPIVQQTQIKTSATAPAGVIGGGQSFTYETDYLILTRPRLD